MSAVLLRVDFARIPHTARSLLENLAKERDPNKTLPRKGVFDLELPSETDFIAHLFIASGFGYKLKDEKTNQITPFKRCTPLSQAYKNLEKISHSPSIDLDQNKRISAEELKQFKKICSNYGGLYEKYWTLWTPCKITPITSFNIPGIKQAHLSRVEKLFTALGVTTKIGDKIGYTKAEWATKNDLLHLLDTLGFGKTIQKTEAEWKVQTLQEPDKLAPRKLELLSYFVANSDGNPDDISPKDIQFLKELKETNYEFMAVVWGEDQKKYAALFDNFQVDPTKSPLSSEQFAILQSNGIKLEQANHESRASLALFESMGITKADLDRGMMVFPFEKGKIKTTSQEPLAKYIASKLEQLDYSQGTQVILAEALLTPHKLNQYLNPNSHEVLPDRTLLVNRMKDLIEKDQDLALFCHYLHTKGMVSDDFSRAMQKGHYDLLNIVELADTHNFLKFVHVLTGKKIKLNELKQWAEAYQTVGAAKAWASLHYFVDPKYPRLIAFDHNNPGVFKDIVKFKHLFKPVSVPPQVEASKRSVVGLKSQGESFNFDTHKEVRGQRVDFLGGMVCIQQAHIKEAGETGYRDVGIFVTAEHIFPGGIESDPRIYRRNGEPQYKRIAPDVVTVAIPLDQMEGTYVFKWEDSDKKRNDFWYSNVIQPLPIAHHTVAEGDYFYSSDTHHGINYAWHPKYGISFSAKAKKYSNTEGKYMAYWDTGKQGDSGSALVNQRGELVGIVLAGYNDNLIMEAFSHMELLREELDQFSEALKKN